MFPSTTSVARAPSSLHCAAVERQIPLEGCFNFRDLGGYPTRDGRRLRWRRLFRADGLQHLTESDVGHLREELRLSDIVDLRSSFELEADGRGRLERESIAFHHVPLFDGDTRNTERPPAANLAALYLGMLEFAKEPIGRVVRLLAEADSSAVYHCAAGKDRTGVISCVLLSLLGVDDELIVADYALSQESMDDIIGRLNQSKGYEQMWDELPPDTLHAMPETMRELLTSIEDRWGSMHGYAREAGLDEAVFDRLAQTCLEPA